MSAIRLLIIRTSTLATILLLSVTGFIHSQSEISSINPVTPIDTSDYFSYFFPDAIDQNLMIASAKGYTEEIKRLISKGANINAETPEGATPLIFAVSSDNLPAVLTLLEFNPVLDKVTRNYETPLLIAAKNRYFEITEALLRAGADMEFTDSHGVSPLHYAAIYGYLDIVDLLLYYDFPVDQKTDDGTTPLLAAIWAGNTDVADLLIQNGAKTEESDNDGFTPFLMSAFYGDTLLMEILYRKGANIYAFNKAKHNALTIAISTGDKITVEYLLRKGKKWNKGDKDTWDPYLVASKYRRNEMVDLLKQNNVPGQLKHGIDQVSFTASTRFSLHDAYAGVSLSFKEPTYNAGLTFGYDTKFWYSRLLFKESENSFYQYRVKESVAYAGFFKDFALSDNINKFNYYVSTSLYAGYTFGNTFKGTLLSPPTRFIVIPDVSFKMTKMNLAFIAGLQYIKTDFYNNGPIWFRVGITYNYFFDNVRIKVKPIDWF